MIDSLSFNGGRGVGRHEGVVIFVPWTAPGDRIRARIVENKKTYLIAETEKILEASKFRRKPPCPVFTRCGGCAWQHVVYEQQTQQKQAILQSALKSFEGLEWRNFIPSPEELRYRNRIQVNKREGHVGFYARGTREIVNISDCPIAEPELAARIPELRGSPDGRYEISRRVDGTTEIEAGRRNPEAALFSQVNSKQNAQLIQTVLAWSKEMESNQLWDLYCGSGNLTLPLAQAYPQATVTGVELSADAIRLAQKASAKIHWVAKDVASFLAKQKNSSTDLLIVLDPPRDGADERVISEVSRLRPKAIIYISCNPMTFSRDARRLNSSGFKFVRVQGFDMFPQTEHVELIGLFQRVI